MIDNFQAKYDFAPDDYCTGVEYSDSTLPDLLARHVTNTSSTLKFKHSNSPIGCVFSPQDGDDIWVKVQPNNDGTETVWWYGVNGLTIDDSIDTIAPSNTNNKYNYIELDGVTLEDEYPLEGVGDIMTNSMNNVIDLTGVTVVAEYTPNIYLNNYMGTVYGMRSCISQGYNINLGAAHVPQLDLSGTDFTNGGGIDLQDIEVDTEIYDLQNCIVSEGTWVNALSGYYGNITQINVSNWDLGDTTTLSCLISSQIDTSGVQPSFIGLGTWDVSNVTDFENLIYDYSEDVSIQNWDVTSATTLNHIYNPDVNNYDSDIDLSGWKIPNNPIDVSQGECLVSSYFPGALHVDDWDLSEVTNIDGLFNGYHTDMGYILGLETWDVSNIESMRYLFYRNIFDPSQLQDWDVSNVEHFDHMFDGGLSSYYYGGSAPEYISMYLSEWRDDLSPNATYTQMFKDVNFVGGDGSYNYPHWNGFIDFEGTFIPYTGSEVQGGVYFKGIETTQSYDYPEFPPEDSEVGDAWFCYDPGTHGYYTGGIVYDGTRWYPVNTSDLTEGYFRDPSTNEWVYYEYPDTGYWSSYGLVRNFYTAKNESPQYLIGEYQWIGANRCWYKVPQ